MYVHINIPKKIEKLVEVTSKTLTYRYYLCVLQVNFLTFVNSSWDGILKSFLSVGEY